MNILNVFPNLVWERIIHFYFFSLTKKNFLNIILFSKKMKQILIFKYRLNENISTRYIYGFLYFKYQEKKVKGNLKMFHVISSSNKKNEKEKEKEEIFFDFLRYKKDNNQKKVLMNKKIKKTKNIFICSNYQDFFENNSNHFFQDIKDQNDFEKEFLNNKDDNFLIEFDQLLTNEKSEIKKLIFDNQDKIDRFIFINSYCISLFKTNCMFEVFNSCIRKFYSINNNYLLDFFFSSSDGLKNMISQPSDF